MKLENEMKIDPAKRKAASFTRATELFEDKRLRKQTGLNTQELS
jgi:hypothetical protein